MLYVGSRTLLLKLKAQDPSENEFRNWGLKPVCTSFTHRLIDNAVRCLLCYHVGRNVEGGDPWDVV